MHVEVLIMFLFNDAHHQTILLPHSHPFLTSELVGQVLLLGMALGSRYTIYDVIFV